MHESRELRELNISEVLPNRFQPRFKFEQDSLEQLAESISKFGVIEPVVVRQIGNKYEIIAGERRYKASKIAGKSTIPAIVVNLSDKDSEELALLENVQRKALNPIEEAVSYKRILDAGYIKREELAKKIGKPQTEILSKIRLLSLSDEVQSYLLNNRISERHARSLLKLSDIDDQVEMLHRIVNERLTVKQTDREIRKIVSESEKKDFEVLSVDERGNDMDIDKIMREAQDINVQEQPAPMPDLMAGANPGVVMPQPVEPVTGDENKFIGPMPAPAAPTPTVSASTGPTFDDMFNAPISSSDLPFSQPVTTASTAMEQMPIQEPTPVVNSANEAPVSPVEGATPSVEPVNVASVSPVEGATPSAEPVSVAPVSPVEGATSSVEPVSVEPVSEAPVQEQPFVSENSNFMNNIPDINILQNNSSQGLDITKVVQMLRDCANEIEKNGHFVSFEENDLGNQYKVTITINK